jgi:tetratricopeptide (TPR) repeat protein
MRTKSVALTALSVLLFILASCSEKPSDYLEDGISKFESGDYESALSNLRRAKYLMPENFEANLYLGKCFLKDANLKDAEYKARYYLKAARNTAKTDAERFDVSLSLLSIYEKKKDYSKIANECRSLVKKDKKLLDKKKAFELNILLADAYFNMEEFEDASTTYEYLIADFKEELAKNPELLAKTHLQFAAALTKIDKERRGEALKYANRSVETEKDSFSEEYRETAAKCFLIIADDFQQDKQCRISRIYYLRAKSYCDQLSITEMSEKISQKITKADEEIEKSCETYDCLMKKGEKELLEQDYEDAADYFKNAQEKGNTGLEKGNAVLRYGIACYLNGNESDALAGFQALKMDYLEAYLKSPYRHRIDLFMGASLILTSKKPDTLTGRLWDKAKSMIAEADIDAETAFNRRINQGSELVQSATSSINEKTPNSFRTEAAEVCESVGDQFESWKMIQPARKFYEKARLMYGETLEKDKVILLGKKLRELE